MENAKKRSARPRKRRPEAELGAAAGTPAANVAAPLTPAEQHAVQSAHHNGSTPVQVGSVPVRPGVVHADIASAVNTLPHSLFAVLALHGGRRPHARNQGGARACPLTP